MEALSPLVGSLVVIALLWVAALIIGQIAKLSVLKSLDAKVGEENKSDTADASVEENVNRRIKIKKGFKIYNIAVSAISAVAFLFFALLVGLVIRDRGIVLDRLKDEIGRTISERELAQLSSWGMLVPGWNWLSLSSTAVGYRASRRKQLDLIELAFLKHRLKRGESGLDSREQDLRQKIAVACQEGVYLA